MFQMMFSTVTVSSSLCQDVSSTEPNKAPHDNKNAEDIQWCVAPGSSPPCCPSWGSVVQAETVPSSSGGFIFLLPLSLTASLSSTT